MNVWKWAAAAAVTLAAAGIIAGCISEAARSANAGAKTYVVATRGTAKPYSYTDDQGALTGYDVEILKEVERRDPSIHFDFKAMSVAAAFVGIDAGEVDVLANQIRRTPAREEKYVYTNEVNNYSERVLVVKKGRDDIHGLEDLKGKKVVVTANSDMKPIVEKFNEKANPPLDVIYTDKGSAEVFTLIATNRADAGGSIVYAADQVIKEQGMPLQVIRKPISVNATYYLLKKDEDHQKLADKIDAAIQSMKDDGTLKKIVCAVSGGRLHSEAGSYRH